MQARYYLGCAIFVLGLVGIMLGNGGFGDNYFPLGIGLCAVGFILIMTGKRKEDRPSLPRGSDAHRAKRRRDAARRKGRRDSGDGRHDDDGDGGDGD